MRLNLELAKKDIECLDYVILHDLAHFIVPATAKVSLACLINTCRIGGR
ncbi:YgjP-like metallopeptidase domain-containing protein [Marinibaculum pumilum]|uniref:YgjP-like metallopeptidase domain-containing protein n=1 Tax=Marinibaculum pumilum TaxID=1766165 RepID=A0ABV7L8X7_9PROT